MNIYFKNGNISTNDIFKAKRVFLCIALVFLSFACERNDLYKFARDGIEYNLREKGPGGGWIFYINPNWENDGWKYMEAAPADLSSSEVWSNVTTAIGVTAQGTAIGTGLSNTTAIIIQAGHTNSAALLCRNYNGGGKTDWFLPSKDELNQMWVNLKEGIGYTPVPGLSSGTYLSSSENGANPFNMWPQSFTTGSSVDDSKSVNSYITRAVRRF